MTIKKEYLVCNAYHQRMTPNFPTREEAEQAKAGLVGTAKDDGGLHVVEFQTPVKETR